MYEDIDDLLPENKKKQSKHKELLDKLRSVEEESYDYQSPAATFLPSSLLKETKKEKEKKHDTEEDDYDPDEWFNSLISFRADKPTGKGKDLFASSEFGKKKKKKKKQNGDMIDYRKEFETESNLFKNFLADQSRFVESLQRKYDSMNAVKSSNRGTNKAEADLVENINQARQLAVQLVEKNANLKKIAVDLNMKQKKEFGALAGDGDNITDFASNYLKQMISERNTIMNPANADISDYTEDDLTEALLNSLSDVDRSEDVDKYLKYENDNIQIYAEVNQNDTEDYNYIAKDQEGNVIPDYPLPSNNGSLSINRSTGIATNKYGNKYFILWR